MYRTEWPTEQKIQHLRDAGSVPVSYFAGRCLVVVVLLLSFTLLKDDWNDFLSTVHRILDDPQLSTNQDLWSTLREQLLRLFIVPAVASFVVFLLAVLVQSKFLFRPALLTLQFDRLNPFRVPGLGSYIQRFLLRVFAWAFFLFLAALFCFLCLGPILGLLNHSFSNFIAWPRAAYGKLLPFVCIALCILAFAAGLSERFAFLLRERMTREEIEQEWRE